MKFILTLFTAFCVFTVNAQDLNKEFTEKYAKQTGAVLIQNVTVITMDSTEVLTGVDVLVRGRKIQSIVPHSEPVAVPKDVLSVDGAGKYLLPGFADCHVHFYSEDDIWLFMVNGITTIRVMSGSEELLALKKQIASKTIAGPKMFVASPMFDDTPNTLYENTETAADCAEIVSECKSHGYDYMKVGTVMNPEFYAAIADKCQKLRFPLVGHAPSASTADMLLANKQLNIDHFLFFPLQDAGALRQLAQSKIWLCPTLSIYTQTPIERSAWDRQPEFWYLHKGLMKEWAKYPKDYVGTDDQFSGIYQLWKAGANIVTGTDCRVEWVAPGFSIHTEIAQLARYGIPQMEALRIATANGAQMLGTADRTGQVKPGMDADLVLLGSNPLADISATKDISAVFCNGMYLSKSDIAAILNRIAESRK